MPGFDMRSSLRTAGIVATVAVALGVGVGTVLKLTVDDLVLWDAAAAAESWARYVAENVADIDEIAAGRTPSAQSMEFFIRSQKIRHVFGFDVIDLSGNVQLTSDGSKIINVHGVIHDETAATAAKSGRSIVAVREGIPPVRPRFYSEAYLPVVIDGAPQAVVAAYVNLNEQHDVFSTAFLRAAFALCVLTGLAVGFPSIAWLRRTKEKRRADAHIRFLALHDALTGLPNRPQLIERLSAAFDMLPHRGAGMAVHFIDLDRFKEINDTFGHDGGDFLLKTVAERLSLTIGQEGYAARLGGDEFVAVQHNVRDRIDAEQFAYRLAAALAAPISFNKHELLTTACIGVALGPADGEDPERLLKSADLALYKCKADGRNCIRFYSPAMAIDLECRIRLEKAIRDAIAQDRFELHYQPIFGLPARNLAGFEALVRLPAEDGSLIPPQAFIPLAEELRLIDRIGTWVLREACRTAVTWPGDLTISVNLSPAQFATGTITTVVAAALADSGLDPPASSSRSPRT